MNNIELGKQLKLKHPGVYDDISDEELGSRAAEKGIGTEKKQQSFSSSPFDNTNVAAPKSKGFWDNASEAGEGFLGGVVNLGKGVAKGLGSTLSNTGQMIDSGIGKLTGLDSISKQLTGKDENPNADIVKPEGTAQKFGFIGEQIAEFFIPGAMSTKIGKVASAATNGSKLAKVASGLAATSLVEGALGLGQTTLQKGKVDSEAKLSGVMGLASPGVFKGLGAMAKGAGNIAKGTLGRLTGTEGAIEEAFNNPNVIKYAREAGQDIGYFTDNVLDEVRLGMTDLAEQRAKEYGKNLAKVKLSTTQVDDISRIVRDKTLDLLDDFDINVVKPGIDDTGKKLNTLDFSNSTLIEGQNVVEKALNDVLSWTDNTPMGLDKLKRRLFSYGQQVASREKRQAKNIIDGIRVTLKKGLEENVDGYKAMTSAYEKSSNVIDEINRAFSLGNKNMKETAIKKVMSSLKESNMARKQLLSNIADKDIISKVAGAQLSQSTPRGLAGTLTATGTGLAFITQPALWPQLFAIALTTSPRIVGEAVTIAGKINNEMIKAGKYTPEIQRAIRELLIKINQEQ